MKTYEQYQDEIDHLKRIIDLKDETIEVLEDTIAVLQRSLGA
jgi:hypothetical protein